MINTEEASRKRNTYRLAFVTAAEASNAARA